MKDLSLYFDYAAATPLNPKSLEEMQPYFSDNFYNPGAIYKDGLGVKAAINEARQTVASELGARPSEIIFTAGGSEANNMAIFGVMKRYPKANIVCSAIEHDSVLECAKNVEHKVTAVNNRGLLSIDNLEQKIDENTVLVSIMLVNNEIGSILPIKRVAELIDEIKKQRLATGNDLPLYLHTDACQATNYTDINTARLGVDLMSVNSGKIYGPKQCGALFIKAGLVLEPFIYGGGQEKGLRSGTENPANIIGFAKSLQLARRKSKAESARLTKLRDGLAKQLKDNIPNLQINGPSGSKRIANNLHITMPSIDNERLLMELDEKGIQVATGSACSASNDEPSHVLAAICLPEQDIFSSLRITLGKYSNQEGCDTLAKTIIDLLAKQ